MRALLRKAPSVYGLLAIGLILLIEPALPQYHFSLFWFSLGAAGAAVAIARGRQRQNHAAGSFCAEQCQDFVSGVHLRNS